MFQTEKRFVKALVHAVHESQPQQAVEKVLGEALSIWAGPPTWLGPPEQADISILHTEELITIMSIVWPPHLITEPHNHNMWASIALYEGRENNVLWSRKEESIKPVGAETIGPGEVFSLDAEAIHSVHNPLPKYTAAIHVYGGDFLSTPKSEWEPEHLVEQPRDMAAVRRAFAEAERTS